MALDRLAMYTTVYPGVEQYLASWYRSIQSQTDDAFDLWIGVDELTNDEVVAAIGCEPKAEWFRLKSDASPAAIRQGAMAEIARTYPAVIFVDSDDLLHPTRVDAARAHLKSCDVSGCALRIIDEKGKDSGVVFGPAGTEDVTALLPRHNVFGLSNTAYRSDVLQECLPLPGRSDLIDWQLATRAWLSGARMHFDPTPRMFYRQYSGNVARVMPPFTGEYVLLATRRVMAHYQDLLDGGQACRDRRDGRLEEARNGAREFERSIHSARVLEDYVAALNRLRPRYIWWWCVANPELEHLWKN